MNLLPKLPPLIAAATMIGCSGCSTHKNNVAGRSTFVSQHHGETDRGAIIASERRFDKLVVRDSMPPVPAPTHATAKATVYRMSGRYADNVAISLTPDGKRVLSYPAPSDLTENSTPINLGDGWWLSRCGITPNSVFTRYTYAEYRSLPKAPSAEELIKSVIPGACVTELRQLPMTPQQALADTTAVSEWLGECR